MLASGRPVAAGPAAAGAAAAAAAQRRAPHALMLHRHRRRRPRAAAGLAPRALFSSDGGASLGSLLTGGAVAVSVGAGLVALYNDSAPLGARRRRGARTSLPPPPSSQQMPLLPLPPKQQQQQQQLLPASSDDNLRWAVMGVVSCIPLFNWMAWLFGALDGGPRVYYLYAAMYALPLFQHGLGPGALSDPLALLLVAAGALHCQLERVAATEPEEREALARQLSPPSLVRSAARAAAAALRAADGVEEGARGEEQRGALPPGRERGSGVAGTLGAWLSGGDGGGRKEQEGDDDGDPDDPLVEADRREARRVARMELEAFDRRLKASSGEDEGEDEDEDEAEAEAAAAAAAAQRRRQGQQQGQQGRAPPYWQEPQQQPPPRQKQPAADDDSGGWGG